MKAPLLFGFLLGCGAGEEVRVMAVESEFALTDAQKAKCPRLPSFADRIRARLLVEDRMNDDGTVTKTPPCALSVSAMGDSLRVVGDCLGIPVGKDLLFTLMWYTVSPTGKEIVLAESVGRAPLASVTDSTVDIDFDPTKPNQASLVPRSRAGTGATAASKDHFNCDRSGTSVCDSMNPAPATAMDVDTCSNLEELCQDTLFATSIDQCPPGPRP